MLSDGILPVFVIEGTAPELKWQTMSDRLNVRQGKQTQSTSKGQTKHRANRSHLKAVTREVMTYIHKIAHKLQYYHKREWKVFSGI